MKRESIIKKNSREENKVIALKLLLKEKEQEIAIAEQRAGFFAKKHAEALKKI